MGTSRLLSGAYSFLIVSCAFLVLVQFTGCGSGTTHSVPASGNTKVTLLLSSTANSRLSQFDIGLNSLSLTSKSGKTVNLVTSLQTVEFFHINGKSEPLLTVSVPQDVYTSANATVGPADFTCETLNPPNIVLSTYAYGDTPSSQVTVNLPTPITITGDSMGLSLNLQVSDSATFPINCYDADNNAFSINPTFSLSPVSLSGRILNSALHGRITAIHSADTSFDVALAGGTMLPSDPTTADGQTLTAKTDGKTVYQGINGFALLTVGTFVDMDSLVQPDGSLVAARIAVQDSDTTNLTVTYGPLLYVSSSQPSTFAFGSQDQGFLRAAGLAGDLMAYSFGDATFQISGSFSNLQNLPFVPSFNAANMFDGQNVYFTTHATTLQGGPIYFPAATMTLIPQAINGTITGISSDGGFTTYTVALAPYDLIPLLAVQGGQTTVLTDPNNVVVYVDSNTQRQNTQPLAVGSIMRFSGLLFNDSGILRMDCGQVNDGVALQTQTQPRQSQTIPGQRVTVRTISGR